MEANAIPDRWTLQVLDRLTEQGNRSEAQGRRLDRQESRVDAVEDDVDDLKVAVAQLQTTIKLTGAAIVIATPIITTVLFRVIA